LGGDEVEAIGRLTTAPRELLECRF
jgi:hypothetical protein